MTAAPRIPPAVLDAQRAASDPAISAWVSANAGSGKTHVLVQRVIRLLLDGVDPAKILCLTFTKAAAANMANRVFETLAKWTALDDTRLDAEIAKVEGRPPDSHRRSRARRLFAEALETPGGLKVQTIHAFCTALLHQFPFEADVAASFEVLEERAEAELIDRLRLEVLLEAAGAPDTPLGRALATAIVAAADTTFADVVREAVAQRDAIEGWIARAGGLDEALRELSEALGIRPGETVAAVEAEFCAGPLLPKSEWPALRKAFATGSSRDRENIARLNHASAGDAWTNIAAYLSIFLATNNDQPRADVMTKTLARQHPDLHARLVHERERVCALLQRRKALVARDRTSALITIVDAVLRRYRAEKDQRGVLDYDDLIEKTLALLSADGSAAWVMYKLDLGIDHVLVDEAQDTSPQQWEVIRRLTAEFFAGAGARGATKRSIFVVGDEKQSIFSFQGAAPDRFDEMRGHFQRVHAASGLAFEKIPFSYSFRSSPDVLGAVDEVFGQPGAYRGLAADPVPTVHEAVRASAPGFVEIWDPIAPAEKREIEAWDAPFDRSSEQSPQVQLARRIAGTVKLWIDRGDPVGDGDQRRRVTPGDILVLVRQRGGLFESIIRTLKDAEIDVAGADRLMLTEHIAVMDMMSLADALLLPEDDLALAEILKSPLFGFDDDQLFKLAHERKGTLRTALRENNHGDPFVAATSATLDRLGEAARRQTPFAFYAELLGAGGGRKKMLARLGPEAADALDEFLALALDFESRNAPSLQGFAAWLRAAEAQVKRDMDIARNEVRVMTVHGAKGLEAPIVILADTTTKPAGPRDPRLFTLEGEGAAAEPPPLVWGAARKEDVPAMAIARAAAQRAAEDEHQRLLYVAMTRAADRLIVCGAHGVRGKPPGCWHQLVDEALRPSAVTVKADDGGDDIRRWRKTDMLLDAPGTVPIVVADSQLEIGAPDWLSQLASAPSEGLPVLTPSAAGEPSRKSSTRPPSVREAMARARRRGLLAHTLLHRLPELPVEARFEAARRHLVRAGGALGAGEAHTLAVQVLAVLDDTAFAPLFAPGSRAEVPIVGRVKRRDGQSVAVAGQIDRLAVAPDVVFIGDFKTDREPPRRPDDVSPAYRTQLALYRELVSRLYPGRQVRAALVFTETAALMELPAPMLDACLVELGFPAP